MMLYLNHVPCVDVIPYYTSTIAEHFKLQVQDFKVQLLNTEICGERTQNFDGSVRYIFNNIHNIQTYPVVEMRVNGNTVGTMAAARRLITIKGKQLCIDPTCAAIGNTHKLACKMKQLEEQRKFNRSYAIGKNFGDTLKSNSEEANRIRLAFKQQCKGSDQTYCVRYNTKGLPCADGRCRYYPCVKWHDLLETDAPAGLKGTFYEGMPALMAPKKRMAPLNPIQDNSNKPRSSFPTGKGVCNRSQCEMRCVCPSEH